MWYGYCYPPVFISCWDLLNTRIMTSILIYLINLWNWVTYRYLVNWLLKWLTVWLKGSLSLRVLPLWYPGNLNPGFVRGLLWLPGIIGDCPKWQRPLQRKYGSWGLQSMIIPIGRYLYLLNPNSPNVNTNRHQSENPWVTMTPSESLRTASSGFFIDVQI